MRHDAGPAIAPAPMAAARRPSRTPAVRRFALHYIEMVAVMFLGMAVLGLPLVAVLDAAGSGWSELKADAPAAALAGMGVTMTVPMVAWMLFRGHSRRASADMAAAMLIPTAGVIALLASGLVVDMDTLFGIEHVVMLPSMLAAMLLRRGEYTGGH